jgi:hypothetical protein
LSINLPEVFAAEYNNFMDLLYYGIRRSVFEVFECIGTIGICVWFALAGICVAVLAVVSLIFIAPFFIAFLIEQYDEEDVPTMYVTLAANEQ